MEETGIARRGLMLVLSSPSGAGKTTISRKLLERDGNLSMSVSVTTRPRRPGEVDGQDYHFIDPAEFDRLAVEVGLPAGVVDLAQDQEMGAGGANR